MQDDKPLDQCLDLPWLTLKLKDSQKTNVTLGRRLDEVEATLASLKQVAEDSAADKSNSTIRQDVEIVRDLLASQVHIYPIRPNDHILILEIAREGQQPRKYGWPSAKCW